MKTTITKLTGGIVVIMQGLSNSIVITPEQIDAFVNAIVGDKNKTEL